MVSSVHYTFISYGKASVCFFAEAACLLWLKSPSCSHTDHTAITRSQYHWTVWNPNFNAWSTSYSLNPQTYLVILLNYIPLKKNYFPDWLTSGMPSVSEERLLSYLATAAARPVRAKIEFPFTTGLSLDTKKAKNSQEA